MDGDIVCSVTIQTAAKYSIGGSIVLMETKKERKKTSIATTIAMIPILLAFVSIPVAIKNTLSEF